MTRCHKRVQLKSSQPKTMQKMANTILQPTLKATNFNLKVYYKRRVETMRFPVTFRISTKIGISPRRKTINNKPKKTVLPIKVVKFALLILQHLFVQLGGSQLEQQNSVDDARRDRHGNVIELGLRDKKHKLTFRDRVIKGQKVSDINYVESYKKYNSFDYQEEEIFNCKCTIF